MTFRHTKSLSFSSYAVMDPWETLMQYLNIIHYLGKMVEEILLKAGMDSQLFLILRKLVKTLLYAIPSAV